MDTIINNIAQWISNLKYEDIPERIITKAKLQILNIVAAALSGKHCNALKAAESFTMPDGGSTILSTGKKTNAEYAAFTNALYSMSFDFDDYIFMGHTGHSSVLVSLAAGEAMELTIKDLLVAQIAANEVEGRLGASVLFGPHNGQMWSFIHTVGAAISAAKLRGFSKEQTASAIALSLYQPNYPLSPGFMISDSKLLTAALPILSGMFCAKLAQTDMKGNTHLLEAKNGFLARFAYLPLPHMFSGFGEWWVTDTIAFKPYPGCAYIDTTIDSAYRIMDEYKRKTGKQLNVSDIKGIDVFANILTAGMNELSKMYDNGTLHPVNINFSIPKSLAITLINYSLRPEHLSSAMLSAHSNEINSLSKKITLYHDWRYTLKIVAAFYEAIGGKFLPGNVGILSLIKALRKMKRDMPSIPLNPVGLLKALYALSAKERKSVGRGLRRKDDYVRMDKFIFSFGAKVKLETEDGQVYEAESIIPRGGSVSDHKTVVMDNLTGAIGSEKRAVVLFELLEPQTSVRELVKNIVE